MTQTLFVLAFSLWLLGLGFMLKRLWPLVVTLHRRPVTTVPREGRAASARRRMRLDAGLPLMLDLLVLGLESGQGLTGAWQLACRHCPRGPLARSIEQVLAAWQAGQGRAQALLDWAQREPTASIRQLVSLLNQFDRLGASLAPLLRRQADELRLRQQLEAETRALELPVRLLAPLLICILPCTFLVLLFPIVQQLRQAL